MFREADLFLASQLREKRKSRGEGTARHTMITVVQVFKRQRYRYTASAMCGCLKGTAGRKQRDWLYVWRRSVMVAQGGGGVARQNVRLEPRLD